MKHLLILVLLVSLSISSSSAQQRTISFTVAGAENDTVHLAYYIGNKLYYRDTTMSDASGRGTFSTTKDMPGGVYAIVVDRSKYFELIVNEPVINIHSNKANMAGSVVVKKSKENRVFYEYIHFLEGQRTEANEIKELIKATSSKQKKSELEAELIKTDKAVKDYQKKLIQNNNDMFVADLIRMSLPVELEQPKDTDGSVDSSAAYYQYRQHYWDNFKLTDPKIVNTPVFHNKLEEYISKTIPQIPDTITMLVDKLIADVGDNNAAFKYVVHHTTHKYESSEVMGMDAVFAHMGLTYYCPKANGKSRVDWMSEEKIQQLCERVAKLSPLLIGKKAPYLKLTDTTEQHWISYHDMPQDFIIIVFWDPHCGACKKEMPAIRDVYEQELKDLNVGVYAVAKAVEERGFTDWKKFIAQEKLDWVNVGLTTNIYKEAKTDPHKYIPEYTTLGSLNYSDAWDVFSTPKLFVVDKDRKIVAKQLAAEQLVDLIKQLRKRDAKPAE